MFATDRGDVRAWIERLRGGLRGHLPTPSGPVAVACAPGRIDVMGGISDYSGGLVCACTIDYACVVAAQRRTDGRLRVMTVPWNDDAAAMVALGQPDAIHGHPIDPNQFAQVEIDVADLLDGTGPTAAANVVNLFPRDDRWALYCVGVLWGMAEAGHLGLLPGEPAASGLTLVLSSRVPPGAGLSSSAALEIATIQALCCVYEVQLDDLSKARLCQRAEHLVVGMPCGIMDQLACLLGRAGQLLHILCQPHDVRGSHELPAGVRVLGLHSGVARALVTGKYIYVRICALMGQRIIAEALRVARDLPAGADPTGGYLARIDPDVFVREFRDLLPTKIKGADYLRKYGPLSDPLHPIEPGKLYRVRSRTEHHIYENRRVHRFSELLRLSDGHGHDTLTEAGELMYASHWSYGQRCGLGTVPTEFLVSRLRSLGPAAGVYGAKITGGGMGGTIAVLCRDGTDQAIGRVVAEYEGKFGRKVTWITQSGDGAAYVTPRSIYL